MCVKEEIESLHVSCLAYLGDMGNFCQCQELFAEIKKEFGVLDVLVNNAGVSYIGLLQDMLPEDWKRGGNGGGKMLHSAREFGVCFEESATLSSSHMHKNTHTHTHTHTHTPLVPVYLS